jgi:antitoxin FitA
MATLQVKNLPDELHNALRDRAVREGLTLSDLVVRMLRRELAMPSMADWLAAVRQRPSGRDIDVPALLDQVRTDIGDERP